MRFLANMGISPLTVAFVRNQRHDAIATGLDCKSTVEKFWEMDSFFELSVLRFTGSKKIRQ